MVIPQKGGKVFKFELSVVLFKLMVLLVGVLVIASAAVFLDYIFVKERSKKLKNIKKAMMLQSLRVQTINNKLTGTEKKLDDFEDFERKLRLISGTQESGSRIRYLGNSGNFKNGDTPPLDQGDEIIPKLKKLDLDIKLLGVMSLHVLEKGVILLPENGSFIKDMIFQTGNIHLCMHRQMVLLLIPW